MSGKTLASYGANCAILRQSLPYGDVDLMARTHKRREPKKNYGPQKTRPRGDVQQKRQINWTKVAAIAIGVFVSLSMVLALFATSGHPG